MLFMLHLSLKLTLYHVRRLIMDRFGVQYFKASLGLALYVLACMLLFVYSFSSRLISGRWTWAPSVVTVE